MEHIFQDDESFSNHLVQGSEENLIHVTSEETQKRKRNRQVLSWQECKRRKIKCDRKLPCTACISPPFLLDSLPPFHEIFRERRK
ncbi:hypothetical protein BT69DRAFT_233108 [Atractiella rhizophila]|nr:hypothetical protein BT69DRAFT_233108 [Atractiella rhizophila]